MTDEELPSGWAITTLRDVATKITDGSHNPPPKQEHGFPMASARNINGGRIDLEGCRYIDEASFDVENRRTDAKAKDIVLSIVDSIGRSAVISEHIAPICFQRSVAVIDVQPVDPHFIRYQFASRRYQTQLDRMARGVAQKGVYLRDLATTAILVAPINEQRRIVERIDELFSQIEAGEAALARAKQLLSRYRQAVLKAAVTGELTKDWRERHQADLEPADHLLTRIRQARREAWEKAELKKLKAKGKPPKDDSWKKKYKEPEPPDTIDLPELPEGWVWATLPMLGEFGRGKSKHRPRNDPKLYGGNYPFIQTGDVRSSRGRIYTFDNTYNELGLKQSRLWPEGTVYITIAANIAETGILKFPACFPDSVVGLVSLEYVSSVFVELFIRTAREDIERYAPATAQKNINLEILSELGVPLPSEKEQQLIAEKAEALLSEIDALESELVQSERRAAALRQAILTAGFTGKLVPQDPADEPAAALLGRIRAERAAPPPRRRGRPPPREETRIVAE